ncbi:collagenase [Peptoniphilus asaccharolyticus DSM 20463]|uniref:Collagenase n=1 Tax=Peptoniphilus asaccharolyticus DSM 20463 TaxID=573058 RepID=A0A1W1V1M4_PEPAS|nr:hypothetical protein [Peptoniphilus asaccharolyticus]MBL7575540.1 hypothetical protein [Peptoniphilus asaccharolyticus]SMB87186.1 collagenase [Peptoniphilus asaccharolyticus DSM 20463]
MKVKELIEILNQYDDDCEIYGDDYRDVLEIYDVEEGIDKIYIMMQDM